MRAESFRDKKGDSLMGEKSNYDYSKLPFTGLDLVFGIAIGAALGFIITGVFGAGVRTGVGLGVGKQLTA